MNARTIGYSGRSLAQKLGMAEGRRIRVLNGPADYRQWLAPLPPGVVFERALSARTDIVHLFVARRADLAGELPRLRETIRADAAVWISWPKRASKVATDVTEDVIRELALPLGFVDIKVCAVSDVWSGLKLVIRKELR
jgi:hypothetical protein